MNSLFGILLVLCLNQQIKGITYQVEPVFVLPLNEEHATISEEDDPLILTVLKDLKQGTLQVNYYDIRLNSLGSLNADLCNENTSTENGTVSTIFFKSIGLNSCPVSAGNYTLGKPFQVDGLIETAFTQKGDLGGAYMRALDESDDSYFGLFVLLRHI